MPEPQQSSIEILWEERTQQALERRRRLMSFGPHAQGIYVKTPGGSFVVDPEDGFISAALLNEGSYSDGEYRLIKSTITPESDVLIVGAHIGTHAVRLSRHCRNMVAVEANPRTFDYLQANLRLNACTNVTAHNLAVGDKTEKIRFLLNRENSGGSKRMPLTMHQAYVYDAPEEVEVEAVPLDNLLGSRVFDLILMDIEGSEYFALKGMPQLLAKAKTLAVEFMPHMVKNVAGVGVDDYLALLLPCFQWMGVPLHNRVYSQADIPTRLAAIYAARENHETIFFLKDPLPDWILRRQKL